jgi:nucleobase:cation symporter-1, NCS1 family
MAVTTAPNKHAGHQLEAPLTLTTETPRTLGLFDQTAMWGNFGISLFGPVTGAYVAAYTGDLLTALLASLVGSVVGALILGASAVFGSHTGAPAMVALRGMFGRRGSVVPTVLNIAQSVGWATVEIILISTVAAQVLGGSDWRWAWALVAGVVATTMAIRPLGSVRLLRKAMVLLVPLASAYLFYEVLSHPVHEIPGSGSYGFWPAVDVAMAGIVSFSPLAADYSRHSRTNRAAFGGAAIGYGAAALVYLVLGALAVATLATDADTMIATLVALPVGALTLAILAVDEVDEAFANIYSTTMSTHNVLPQVDRRVISATIGVIATALALFINMDGYTDFLYLVGSVFIPLFAVATADFFVVCRMRWDVSDRASFRWAPVAAWLVGFVSYQLLNPGTLRGWSDFWYDVQGCLHFTPPVWMGASIGSILVGGATAMLFGLIARGTRHGVTR